MKRILTLILILSLCLCLAVPVLAEYPQTAEEAIKRRALSASIGLEDKWVDMPLTLYNHYWAGEDTIPEIEIDGYNLLTSDASFTLKNTSDDPDFYIWVYLEIYQKNEAGQYELDNPIGATLRERGFIPCYVDDTPNENGDGLVKLYAGEEVTFTVADLEKGYPFEKFSDDVIYRIWVYQYYPDVDKSWYSVYDYHVDEEEVSLRKDAEAKAKAEAEKTKENPFTDVPEDAYYHDAVLWALANGVTTGATATTFEPASTCTRGQVATFLWRAKGCPEPTTTANPFTDVKESDYFYKPVLWALENGITTGATAATFEPDATCTSAQVVTFLWRAEGKPAAAGESALAAAYPGEYYTDAVAWADIGGLLAGTGSEFVPAADSPRADIVTYLYRNIAE